jgi:hypothetical protein
MAIIQERNCCSCRSQLFLIHVAMRVDGWWFPKLHVARVAEGMGLKMGEVNIG